MAGERGSPFWFWLVILAIGLGPLAVVLILFSDGS